MLQIKLSVSVHCSTEQMIYQDTIVKRVDMVAVIYDECIFYEQIERGFKLRK